MKKTFLTLGLFLMSVAPALAYYGDYDNSRSESSPFSIFLALIVFVFGVLQIFLFFKVWGMTNDVKQIKEKYVSPVKSYNATITYFGIKALEGNEAAKKYIINEIIKELSMCDTSTFYKRERYSKMFNDVKEKFKLILDDSGIEFPEMEEYINLVSPNEYKGFKIDDKVRMVGDNQTYTIIGFNVIKDTVRVKNSYESTFTIDINDLKKIEESKES